MSRVTGQPIASEVVSRRGLLGRTTVVHRVFVHSTTYLQSFVLLFIRLCFGWELFVSGRSHLHNVPGMVKNFTEWGVPLPQLSVYISGWTEVVGGLLILIGLASRLISIPLTVNFIVAYMTASNATIKSLVFGPNRLDAVDKFTSDAAFFFLVAALVILAFGPGLVSLDALIKRIWGERPASTVVVTPGDPRLYR